MRLWLRSEDMLQLGVMDKRKRREELRREKGVNAKGTPEAKAKQQASRLRAGKRKCSRCKEVFYKERGVKDAICSRCKEHCSRCDILLTKETEDKTNAKLNKYHCKKCVSEIVSNTMGNAGYTESKRRDAFLIRRYGITLNEYEKILAHQNGVCWICGRPPGKTRLHVDHKHRKNDKKRNPREVRKDVRGILCWACNSAISKFKDNPELMRKAADYLEKIPAQENLN